MEHKQSRGLTANTQPPKANAPPKFGVKTVLSTGVVLTCIADSTTTKTNQCGSSSSLMKPPKPHLKHPHKPKSEVAKKKPASIANLNAKPLTSFTIPKVKGMNLHSLSFYVF
jgi:hypothetical protein